MRDKEIPTLSPGIIRRKARKKMMKKKKKMMKKRGEKVSLRLIDLLYTHH